MYCVGTSCVIFHRFPSMEAGLISRELLTRHVERSCLSYTKPSLLPLLEVLLRFDFVLFLDLMTLVLLRYSRDHVMRRVDASFSYATNLTANVWKASKHSH
jgi:hypothetical protein